MKWIKRIRLDHTDITDVTFEVQQACLIQVFKVTVPNRCDAIVP